jgi:hypothetical protein
MFFLFFSSSFLFTLSLVFGVISFCLVTLVCLFFAKSFHLFHPCFLLVSFFFVIFLEDEFFFLLKFPNFWVSFFQIQISSSIINLRNPSLSDLPLAISFFGIFPDLLRPLFPLLSDSYMDFPSTVS